MYSYGPLHMAEQKQDDQHEHTFSNYVRIRDVVRKTCLGRWTIGRSGERGSGISVLPARHDDGNDDERDEQSEIFCFISYRLGLPGIFFMLLSVPFSIIPSAPTITGTVVIFNFYFQVIVFTYFCIHFDWYYFTL